MPRRCCPEPLLCWCAESCDFATSYVVSAMSGTFSFQSTSNGLCLNTHPQRDVFIDITWSMNAPWMLTRTGTAPLPCCYQGDGTVSISGSIRVVWHGEYQGGMCTSDNTYYFTDSVMGCLTVQCMEDPQETCVNGPKSGWVHSLQICDFTMVCSVEDLLSDFEEPSCRWSTPKSLRSPGAMFRWVSPMQPLSYNTQIYAIRPGSANYCSGQIGPTPPIDTVRCLEWSAHQTAYGGLFSVYWDEECSLQDPIPPCTLNEYVESRTWLSTGGFHGPCPSLEQNFECGDTQIGWTLIPPTYT